MASLRQQLSTLAIQLEQLRDAIPVDQATTAVTLEQHSPGNGSVYTRLRSPKGKALSNGKRTMSLDAKGAAEWEQKIYARNQQAKVAQCLALVQQAAAVAGAITWDFEEEAQVVNQSESFTSGQTESIAPRAVTTRPAIKYVFKDAKGATPINRKVHAIAEQEPDYGRWHSPALCGERPRAGTWGWCTCDPAKLSCPQCSKKVKVLQP
ncbi:hypothetical protein [Leptolyngbya sp. BC1307]|uniref:hypothetical protein n=1 Tax=Leptolyngbya sp. BC1307 TaxID=2029589 RepID=UPI000EFB93ED|nr:hypothetical protein [Leptolyngbya sp. BC1307]